MKKEGPLAYAQGAFFFVSSQLIISYALWPIPQIV